MEAIILASGIGKRLGNLGKKQPKCMLNLKKNIKIIDKLINDLEGINKINIVIGYKKNDLKNHLSKHKKKIRFIYNKHWLDVLEEAESSPGEIVETDKISNLVTSINVSSSPLILPSRW